MLADGKKSRDWSRGGTGMVMFQESALFPWLDGMGNVLFSGSSSNPASGRPNAARWQRFTSKLVGLDAFMDRNIHELSGGMKQRVALSRALAPTRGCC